MILAMSCISILGSVVWGHHMYIVGMESDTRAYFTAVTMMISLPTGTKIFNWLCTYLNNELHIRTSAALFTLIFLLMFTIGGSTGVILGNAVVDIALHDTYYVVAHFHFVLSLGAVIAIFSGIMYFQDKISGPGTLPTSTSYISRYHFIMTFFGILLTFTPMHFLGFNVMPRRIPDFPDYFNSISYFLVHQQQRNVCSEIQLLVSTSRHRDADVEFCLPTINSISTMNRHDVVGVRKEKVILIALNCEVGN